MHESLSDGGSKSRSVARLSDVHRTALTPSNARRLAEALGHARGAADWRARKEVEARELLALSQIAPPGRLDVAWFDLGEDFRALLHMTDVPVPCQPGTNNALRIHSGATLGMIYPSAAPRQSLPGSVFFQILSPHGVWLPQVAPPQQQLCVAASVPAGTPVRALVLMAYGALTMQSIQMDASHPAGVFQPAIAEWWQSNLECYVPLTRTPFLGVDDAR